MTLAFRPSYANGHATRTQVQALSLPQLEALGEALLDFTKPEDLDEWMRSRSVADSKSNS
ncbi:DUF4351 domain-containing protein [Moorena sp. SIO3B2]|uniref:DUF4351 domain-containing protein n=1 Tax=Moorena sp. SIO3B2 TaxID=2607827 RepID=UPI000307F0E1|nr:DUF4351 domain-containing protein [Moorena sp. SIO3B2]